MENFLEECLKLSELQHPNVMEIVGVCQNEEAAPFLVMPFMSNGNLLQYLNTNRKRLVLPADKDPEELV